MHGLAELRGSLTAQMSDITFCNANFVTPALRLHLSQAQGSTYCGHAQA